MRFNNSGRAKAGRLLLLAAIAVGGSVVIQRDHWFVVGHNGMYVSIGFMFVAALILIIRYRWDPTQRAAFVTLFKDRNAMTFGVLAMILALVTNFVDHGFHDVLSLVIQALLFGFTMAAISNWFHGRKQRSSGQ